MLINCHVRVFLNARLTNLQHPPPLSHSLITSQKPQSLTLLFFYQGSPNGNSFTPVLSEANRNTWVCWHCSCCVAETWQANPSCHTDVIGRAIRTCCYSSDDPVDAIEKYYSLAFSIRSESVFLNMDFPPKFLNTPTDVQTDNGASSGYSWYLLQSNKRSYRPMRSEP